MISVAEVVVDPDFIAPQPYTILRSTGQFVEGGFKSVTVSISVFGPVQQASNREVQMLPEADRIGAIRSFWSTQPFFTTRGYAPLPGTTSEAPTPVAGAPLQFTLSANPPSGVVMLYQNGLFMTPGVDYTLSGRTITFKVQPTGPLYVTWEATVDVGADASDKIQYGNEVYRVLNVYFDPGGGYWKALATRLAAA